MRNFFILTDALRYIEEHLEAPIGQEAIAAHCHCSLSALQKLFRYALCMSVKTYIDRRRMTQAACLLLETDATVTEVAMRMQYQSPEVFSRAFRREWGVPPTALRTTWRNAGLFPRVHSVQMKGEEEMKRNVDITDLYEKLRQVPDTYVVCFDMSDLTGINAISETAGDMAIVECLRRIDSAAGEGMAWLRIGGDEFVLVTGYREAGDARKIAGAVLAENGNPVVFEGREIPVAMYAAAIRVNVADLPDVALVDAMMEAIGMAKRGQEVYVAP